MHTLKRFIQYYRPYKTIFFLDLLCATFISIVDLLYPQFLRGAINGLFTESTDKILAALVPIGIGLFLMYVLQSLCKYYVSYQGHMMGAYMERDMRSRLFDHYEKLSFSYYNQNNSGQMMSKLVSDLFDIAEFAHHGPENPVHFPDQDHRILYLPVPDQLAARHPSVRPGHLHADLFHQPE